MSARDAHPSYGGRSATPPSPGPVVREPAPVLPQGPGDRDIDWRAAQRASRSCCCPAAPAVMAVLGPTEPRPHRTELLLCLHHYRSCREGLAAAGARVLDLDGRPVPDTPWPKVNGHR